MDRADDNEGSRKEFAGCVRNAGWQCTRHYNRNWLGRYRIILISFRSGFFHPTLRKSERRKLELFVKPVSVSRG